MAARESRHNQKTCDKLEYLHEESVRLKLDFNRSSVIFHGLAFCLDRIGNGMSGINLDYVEAPAGFHARILALAVADGECGLSLIHILMVPWLRGIRSCGRS